MPGWRVIFLRPRQDYQQLAFVNNSIWTKKGGTHVNSILKEVGAAAFKSISRRMKNPDTVF